MKKLRKKRNSKSCIKRFSMSFLCLAFLFCFVFQGNYVSAQENVTVKGTVTDDSGQSLPGVTILIKGTSNGTVSSIDGNYLIANVQSDATLVFSFVGMASQEVEVAGQTQINIQMRPDAIGLEEVVAIGYGSKRKRDITSAVSVISVDEMGEVPASNASRLLQGQAAGVVVKQKTGTPGEQMNVIIRGVGSLGAGSAPLYVIDGFAVGTLIGQRLNANDIESISILKDAASTAIYGARGSNGVVLITTKNAKKDELSLTATVNYGFQNLPDSRRVKMMSGPEFATFLKESWMDKKRYFEKREPSDNEVPIGIRYPEQTQYSTDWMDEILHNNAPFQDYNLTLASGVGKVKSLISAGYLKQDGAIIETDFERFSLRANITGEINEFITVGLNLVGTRSVENFANSTWRNGIVGRALFADPRSPVFKEDGTYNIYVGGKDGVFGITNPVYELKEYERVFYNNDLTSNGFVEVSFLKDFKFKSSFNASINNYRANEYRPSTMAGGGFNQPPPSLANLTESYQENLNFATDQLLSYIKTIGEHQFNALLGFSAQEATYRHISGNGVKFPNDDIRFLQQAANTSASSSESSWSMLAYFARFGYDYQNKYLLSASFRREGSSRFGKNSKYGNFPAVSVGWRISEESFFEDVEIINDLKFRASYGVTGNNDIGNYNNSSSLASRNYILGNQTAPGVVLNSFVNENIGWEESNQLDIGLDLAMLDNRLVFIAEYYRKETNNMLLPVSVPVITGFTSTFTNVGKVENKGFEFSVDYKRKVNNNLNLRGNFNIAFNRNKVLEIDGKNKELWTGGFYGSQNRSVVGRPIGMITGFKVLGIFQTDEEIANSPTQDGAIPGVYKYWDANGDGKISYDTKDMVEIGNPHPAFTWGLNLGADYKMFDLTVSVTGAQNYDISREIEKTTLNMDGVFNILAAATDGRFRNAENPGNGIIPTSNTWKWEREANSRYVFDGSHAWIKSVTLGYTLPNKLKVLKGTRLYANLDNLWLITNYPGGNPDTSNSSDISPGRDDEAYPVPRTISVGANIKF